MSTATSTPGITWSSSARQAQFLEWLQAISPTHALQPGSLHIASADASFRRYFRIRCSIDGQSASRIIMDAPPEQENSQPFVDIAHLMAGLGLHVPQVLAWQREHGFLLLSDLGAQTMMQHINPDGVARPFAEAYPLYHQALDALLPWQTGSRPGVLPPYDEALMRRELELFPQWYVLKHRGVAIDTAMRATLDKTFALIVQRCLAWPNVFVHRDFMPRNLMVGQDDGPHAPPVARLGVLDFQDAVYGPITYDIASLMRDAFLSWDEEQVLDVTVRYWERARRVNLPVGDDFGAFYAGVEWMGLQRHLKVAGIFARLTLRDGKPRYLADAPRFIQYIIATCHRYAELKPLLRLIEKIEGIHPVTGFAYGRV